CAEAHPWRAHEFDPSQSVGFAGLAAAACRYSRKGGQLFQAAEGSATLMAPPLLHDLPASVRIELRHRGAKSGGVRSEVLLVHDAVLAADKSLDAAVAV